MNTDGMNTASMPRPRLLPYPSPVARPFWDATRRHELVMQWCDTCRYHVFYPRATCPRCGRTELSWRSVSGSGRIYTYTVARRATHRAFAERVPYVVAIVELDEGPHLTTEIVGTDPNTVKIGARVIVEFEDHADISVPVFRPLITERVE